MVCEYKPRCHLKSIYWNTFFVYLTLLNQSTERTEKTLTSMFNPFPNDKIHTIPNSKSLQTTILSLMKMKESSPKG